MKQPISSSSAIDLNHVTRAIAEWPNRPKLGAEQMLAKYGLPQEITAEKMVWHNQGPYKRITVTKAEHHHDFPKPHMDYIEHTIDYQVPPDRAGALAAYDGSLTFDRTRGEMSARCDLEGHNILTLNLAHDIVEGKLSATEARNAFGLNVVDDAKGEYPEYTTALRFTVSSTDTKFADTPVIPGSPERPGAEGSAGRSTEHANDSEVLGLLAAMNDIEIVAALEANAKHLPSSVGSYAQKLHQAHGENLEATLLLGQKMKVTPAETVAVDRLRVKAAGELAALVPLHGAAFATAYIAAKVKGYSEALVLLDAQLIPRAEHDKLKKHLARTREAVAANLAASQELQAAN